MMHLKTKLPFQHLYFRHWGRDDREMAVLIVKAGLRISDGGIAENLLSPQPDILLSDLFHGEVNRSALRQESDLAPFKPRTDLTFNAVARSPEEKEIDSWPVSIAVDGRLSHGFHVFGERFWEPQIRAAKRKWQLSPVMPTTSIPLTYERAYGGVAPMSDEEHTTHAYNPIGRGLVSDYLLEMNREVAAPQIALVGEFAAERPTESMTVCGCGPIQKSWLPRLSLAGTFDDAWARERHPRMPLDYDFAYWNAAPLPMQAAPYLIGDETIRLTGFRHDARPYVFQLPGMALGIKIRREGLQDITEHMLNLDTVHCDIADGVQERHTLSMTWRLTLAEPDDIRDIELFARRP
ncbi:DUF2169 family type VI secretion system accessory protein [Agrobacterium vitis]|uniref:DUF2169 family type VI secretion system accessory protein n=1 Tax=Agrobacterium vitis TaxID=373 RepID=UPI001F41968D|nr:DUF2169 domain-containing protein [Agrobacterium vitis]